MGLRGINRRLQHGALGAVPEAVIDQLRIAWHQLVLQVHRPTVEGDRFDPAVCFKQQGAARRFVNTAGFHPDKTTLDKVKAPAAMFAAKFVQFSQKCRGRHGLAVDAYRIATFKPDLYILGRIWCLLWRDGALVHIVGRVHGRILQHFAFRRGVQQVRIHAKRRFATFVLRHGDLMFFGKFDQFSPAGQVPFPPWRDHLDVGVQRIGRQFETNLIVALACRAMRNGVGAGFGGDFNKALGNQRARDGGAQQV